jgi:hypothetical protein
MNRMANLESLETAATLTEATRAIIQSLSGGMPLEQLPERCSLKPPGTNEWVAHLDRARHGGFQVVIALTTTTFIVWPGSHLHPIGRHTTKKGYYQLTKVDKNDLEQAGHGRLAVAAEAGDVLIMMGGVCVHSSPGVAKDQSERIATYAHWVPKVD